MNKKGKGKDDPNVANRLKEFTSIISDTPAKKRAKKIDELINVETLLQLLTQCNEMIDSGADDADIKRMVKEMSAAACDKTTMPHITFRDLMGKDATKGAQILGYKSMVRTLVPMETQASPELMKHLNKVTNNVIMDVESARELLIYPIMVEAVSTVPDVYLRIQPELNVQMRINGVLTIVSGRPDMTAGKLNIAAEQGSSKKDLLDFVRSGTVSISQHFCVGENKRISEYEEGLGQLQAQMAATRTDSPAVVVNGVLTDGDNFKFVTLDGDTFYVTRTYKRDTELSEILAYLALAMSGKPLPAKSSKKSKAPVSSSSSCATISFASSSSSSASTTTSAFPSDYSAGYPPTPPDDTLMDPTPIVLNYGKVPSQEVRKRSKPEVTRRSQRIKNKNNTCSTSPTIQPAQPNNAKSTKRTKHN